MKNKFNFEDKYFKKEILALANNYGREILPSFKLLKYCEFNGSQYEELQYCKWGTSFVEAKISNEIMYLSLDCQAEYMSQIIKKMVVQLLQYIELNLFKYCNDFVKFISCKLHNKTMPLFLYNNMDDFIFYDVTFVKNAYDCFDESKIILNYMIACK